MRPKRASYLLERFFVVIMGHATKENASDGISDEQRDGRLRTARAQTYCCRGPASIVCSERDLHAIVAHTLILRIAASQASEHETGLDGCRRHAPMWIMPSLSKMLSRCDNSILVTHSSHNVSLTAEANEDCVLELARVLPAS